MTLISQWRCWQIMQCDPEAKCSAKEHPEEECWNVIGAHDPCSFNICRDCLVYVVKKKDAVLSEEEIRSILAHKGIELVVLPADCQACSADLEKV